MKYRIIIFVCLLIIIAGCGTTTSKPQSSSLFPANAGNAGVETKQSTAEFFTRYPSYEQIDQFVHQLAQQAPDMVRLLELGKSFQNRPIYALEIGGVSTDTNKSSLYIDATHHGNEIITTMVALYFARYLVTHHDKAPIRELLADQTVYLIPCVNPDGFVKRRRQNANGVDLNRNYPRKSNRPAETAEKQPAETYPGKEPLSEIETRTITNFISGHKDIKMVVSYHSGIDRIIMCHNEPKQSGLSNDVYKYLSEQGQLLTANRGFTMTAISPLSDIIGGEDKGTLIDWSHSKGIYSFVVECYSAPAWLQPDRGADARPPWKLKYGYYPPAEDIFPICNRWVDFNLFMFRSVGKLAVGTGQGQSRQLGEPKLKTLEERENKYIDEALKMLNLTRQDTEFPKALENDPFRLEKVQDSLDKPLELPDKVDKLGEQWHNVINISQGLRIQIEQLGKRWVVPPDADLFSKGVPRYAPTAEQRAEIDNIVKKSPREFQPVLENLLNAIFQSQNLMDRAFQKLSLDERKYLVKYTLPKAILKGDTEPDDFQIDADKVNLQLAGPDAKLIHEGRDEIDPEEVAALKLSLKIDYGYLAQAGLLVASAVDDAIEMLKDINTDNIETISVDSKIARGQLLYYAETSLGPVIIGSKDNNTYYKDALLIIDMGGDDRYFNSAGGANGLSRPATAVVIDMSGNDFYSATRKFSQGSGLFGIGILADLGGNDIYQAKHYAQGCAMFGIGILWDTNSARDYFSADTCCQGSGGWGVGILYDESGDTQYFSRTFSQGVGFTFGTGALIDKAGDDYYIAAGTIENNRPYSMSQGFGQGNRPIASGGIGILIDEQGNDHYTCQFYGQGSAYWLGLGILIDNGGNDRYDAVCYAQGCGIHLSTGILIDRGGNDFYNCSYGGNAQGAAHDLAVGILVDKNGNDTYVGRGNNQGSAITNAFALFIDSSGDDVYYTLPKGGQGYGGAARGRGSIGLFLDLGGNDFYSEEYVNPDTTSPTSDKPYPGQTKNNSRWIKGDKGAGIDTE